MTMFIVYWKIIFLSLLSEFSYGQLTTGIAPLEKITNRPRNCEFERAYKMDGYNCIRMDLKDVPQNLKTSVKILDLSYNRIRDLTQSSFKRYTSLKYLYLFENMIQFIEEGTFAELTDLEAIDLSTNGLRTIPMELFSLSHLRNLRIAQNSLYELMYDLEKLNRPIIAPLRELSLAECKLMKIPNFGILPKLQLFNLSGNPLDLTDVSYHEFSPYCNLKILDLNDTRIHACTCIGLTRYLEKRGVGKIYSLCQTTEFPESYCGDKLNQTNQITEPPEYHECKQMITTEEAKEKSSLTWTTVLLILFGFFVLFVAILYCVHRNNVKRIMRKNKEALANTNVIRIKETKPNDAGADGTVDNNHETLLDVDKS